MVANDTADGHGRLMRVFVAMERFSVGMAVIGGGLLTLLAVFITADVLGRGFGGLYSGATDEIAGYAMSLAITWSLAYTLTIDKHVRVDLLLGVVSPRLRRLLDWIALALLTLFAIMLAWNCWGLAFESLQINSRSPGVLQTPIGIPQSAMALGFTVLAVQGVLTLAVATFDPAGRERMRAAEQAAAPAQFDV
jgi:C4-dicarboxylate transporter, DctQ subunit